MNRESWFCSACLGALSIFTAPLVHAASLMDVYELARDHDPVLQAASFELAASRELIPQNRSILLPQLNAQVYLTRNDDDTPFTNDRYTNEGYSISLTQTIYNHSNYARLRQAKSAVQQAEASFLATQQSLIVRVAGRYFDILAAQDNLEFVSAEREAIARELEQAQKRFEVGLTAVTDVKEAQASFDRSVADEIDAKNQLDTANEAMRQLTNQWPENLQTLRDSAPLLQPEPQGLNNWAKLAEENNPNYIAARFAVDAALAQVQATRADHYPTVDLVGNYSNDDRDGGVSIGESETTSLTLQLNVPIYSGGLVSALAREARANYSLAQQTLENERRISLQQVRDAYRGVLASISQVEALQQALESQTTAAEATQAGFDVGTRTAVDVLLALRETFRAASNYSRARYDFILGTLELKQAAGTLSIEDLRQVAAWLE